MSEAGRPDNSPIQVRRSERGDLCLLSIPAGHLRGVSSAPDSIYDACAEHGFQRGELIPAEDLRRFLDDSIRKKSTVSDVPLNKDVDSAIEVTVSEDALRACLYLRKARGSGKALSLKEIGEVISSKKLKGMNTKKAKSDILEFHKGPAFELKDYTLAEGKPAQQGEDGQLVWEIDFLEGRAASALREQIQRNSASFESVESALEFPVTVVKDVSVLDRGVKIAKLQPAAKGASGVDVFGRSIPGLAGKDPPRHKLFGEVQLLRTDIVSSSAGILEVGEQDSCIYVRVRPHQDAEVRCEFAADRMHGYVSITPHEGTGDSVTPDTVRAELESEGIVKGIKEDALQGAVDKALAGERVDRFAVAEGAPPVHGSMNQLVLRVQLASGKQVTMTKNGKADFRTHDSITLVKKGQVLAEILPPENVPEDGWDVFGKTVPARRNEGSPVEVGANIEKVTDDGGVVKIVAAEGGELRYDGKVMEIEQVHVVEGDVGLKTGNVRFPGAVRIKGSVLDGFRVVAGADILVDNLVQGALLSSEGSIEAGQGIKGGGKAILRAKGEIRSSFAEQAMLLSVGDVKIKNACLRCHVKCNGKVILGADRGSYVGGSVRTKRGLDVKNLGSRSEVRTEVAFGQDYLVGDQIDVEEKGIETCKKKIADLDIRMRKLERSRSEGGNSEELEKARKEKLLLLKQMERGTRRLFILRERFEEHFPSEVVVRGTVYPGVVVESHGRYYMVKEKKNGTVIFFNGELGTVQERPLS